MRRCVVALLLLLCLAPLAGGQSVIAMGIVTYSVDAMAQDFEAVQSTLSTTLNMEVGLYETPAAAFCTRDALSEMLARLSVSAQQVEALEELRDLAFEAILLTPAAPVEEADPLTPIVRELVEVNETPLALTVRRIEGLDLPLFGVDAFQLGVAWAQAMEDVGPRPFAVVGYFIDPLQADLLEGLKTSPHFRGAYPVVQESGSTETSQAYKDHPDLAAIIVTDHSLVTGASDIVSYLHEELGSDIRLGALGVPENWEALFEQGLLHGIVAWDHYALLLQASSALSDHLSQGVELLGAPTDLMFYGSDLTPINVAFPYFNAALAELWK